MIIRQYTFDELTAMTETLTAELVMADRGERTSIPYIRHEIHAPSVSGERLVQALVIGGSNAATAAVRLSPGMVTPGPVTKMSLPFISSRQVLLDLCDRLIPPGCTRIGINFAYHLQPLVREGRLDGILNRGTKSHRFDGLIGHPVGEAIEAHREGRGESTFCVVANDTVCLLLSGLSFMGSRGLAAGIVGTGFNFGFFASDDSIINLESGDFNRFAQTESGIVIDRESNNPGEQRWEKEISGAYLYRHFNWLAAGAGLTERCDDTAAVSRLAAAGGPAAELARGIICRSASLVAVEIAALHRFLAQDRISLVMEGSLYWYGWRYTDLVYEGLAALGLDREQVLITAVEESSIVGAAWLALTAS